MGMRINIVVACGLLDVNDTIEIDRFKRFRKTLELNSQIVNPYSDITWTFAEFGNESKLKSTILSKFPDANYVFVENTGKFDQVALWNKVIEKYNDCDFYCFLHSDIVLHPDIYNVLYRRLQDKAVNYYASKFNYYSDINGLAELIDGGCYVDDSYNDDYGFKYVLDQSNQLYKTNYTVLKYNINTNQQQFSLVPDSFMCISNDTISKIDFKNIVSYHNDVIIRDKSALCGVGYEWLNDELVFVHLNGKDDAIKTANKDYECTEYIIKNMPELAHYGLFRFREDFLQYMANIDIKNIFDNYIEYKMPHPDNMKGKIDEYIRRNK